MLAYSSGHSTVKKKSLVSACIWTKVDYSEEKKKSGLILRLVLKLLVCGVSERLLEFVFSPNIILCG